MITHHVCLFYPWTSSFSLIPSFRSNTQARCFVHRALLYNDGGFDVSPDGKTLCACAEYWLPEGVDNATDLLHGPGNDDDVDDDDDYYDSDSDGSSGGEIESHSSRSDRNDVDMDKSNEVEYLNRSSPQCGPSKVEKLTAADTSSRNATLINDNDLDSANEKASEDANHDTGTSSTDSQVSPMRSRSNSSSHPSETPPQIVGRRVQPIASPPLALGATAGAIPNAPSAYSLPMPPIQTGMTPQTPPPNVNPLNFPLSPPSPPGRRFAGGLGGRGPQQHEQLLQFYNRQHAMYQQQRHGQQQQQVMQQPRQQRAAQISTSTITTITTTTPPSRGTETATATIPDPPGINHRNEQQHRRNTQQQRSSGGLQNAGNPFSTSSRNHRGATNTNARQRGRFVPHVVTLSLDVEPYVEAVTEEFEVGPDDTVPVTSHFQQLDNGRILTTTGIKNSNTADNAGGSNTITVTKTTYNIPGRSSFAAATLPHILERRPRLGQLLSACPLDGAKASAVTCVKFSPCTEFCLIGYGVREPHVEATSESGETNAPSHPPYHPVTAMYRVNKGGTMRHVSTMLSGDDDVNIARFHPDSGYGFVYGTKQGRIRILGPRPWNYYNC